MANVSHVGAVNGSGARSALDGTGLGADSALFLKVFSGEILTTFDESNVMKDLTMMRTISSGKSAQFPVTGTASAKYHTPGENIITGSGYLSQIGHNEKVINVDNMLIASTMIANIDEIKNHYDLRSIYAKELGKALAKRCDMAIMKTFIAAARETTPSITGQTNKVGTQIAASDLNSANALIDKLFECATKLDEKDVPQDGRFAVLPPSLYYKLITANDNAIDRDFGTGGNVASGTVASVAGITLYKSNHLRDLVTAADGSDSGTGIGEVGDQEVDDTKVANDVFGSNGVGYNADFGNIGSTTNSTGFIAGHGSAVGTVKLLDLATESEYKIENQSTLFVAKYAMGHGVLRPECAIEVLDTSTP